MFTTPSMGLVVWNQPTDPYESTQLAGNWAKVDEHDHTAGKGLPITTAALADGAITSVKLAPDVTVPAASISSAELAANSVTTSHIVDGTILTADLADGIITTPKVVDGAITSAKVLDGAITTAKILDGTIDLTDLATATKNTFLKLASTGDHKVAFGLSTSASWGAINSTATASFTHGLGTSPTFVLITQANNTSIYTVPRVNSVTGTQVNIDAYIIQTDIAFNVSAQFYVLAIA